MLVIFFRPNWTIASIKVGILGKRSSYRESGPPEDVGGRVNSLVCASGRIKPKNEL